MPLDVGVYTPNQVLVEAVEVTRINHGRTADWCGGVSLRTHHGTGEPYVMVRDPEGEYQVAMPGSMIVHDPTQNTYVVMDKEEFNRLWRRINEEQEISE